jgi:hypothetical protein
LTPVLVIKKYLSIELEDNQDHPTDKPTDNSEKSNGGSNQQGHENEGDGIS